MSCLISSHLIFSFILLSIFNPSFLPLFYLPTYLPTFYFSLPLYFYSLLSTQLNSTLLYSPLLTSTLLTSSTLLYSTHSIQFNSIQFNSSLLLFFNPLLTCFFFSHHPLQSMSSFFIYPLNFPPISLRFLLSLLFSLLSSSFSPFFTLLSSKLPYFSLHPSPLLSTLPN